MCFYLSIVSRGLFNGSSLHGAGDVHCGLKARLHDRASHVQHEDFGLKLPAAATLVSQSHQGGQQYNALEERESNGSVSSQKPVHNAGYFLGIF